MKIVLSVAVACAIMASAVFFGLQYLSNDPSTELLDQDIDAVTAQIALVEKEQAVFGPGAIQNVFKVRTEILKTTLAMLEQKRASVLRRIDLRYTVDGTRHTTDDAVLASLIADKKAAEDERDRFKREAAQYSGGLIQTVALLNAATSEIAIVQADLAIMSERYGFVFDMSSVRQGGEPAAQATVEDEEAL